MSLVTLCILFSGLTLLTLQVNFSVLAFDRRNQSTWEGELRYLCAFCRWRVGWSNSCLCYLSSRSCPDTPCCTGYHACLDRNWKWERPNKMKHMEFSVKQTYVKSEGYLYWSMDPWWVIFLVCFCREMQCTIEEFSMLSVPFVKRKGILVYIKDLERRCWYIITSTLFKSIAWLSLYNLDMIVKIGISSYTGCGSQHSNKFLFLWELEVILAVSKVETITHFFSHNNHLFFIGQ